MMPLLEGTDGINKMSKSLGNYIGINEAPREIFGKVMSISDELMWRYYELLSFRAAEDIARDRREVREGRNPRDIKVMLAQELVERFHDRRAAQDALTDFELRFKQQAIPDDIPEFRIAVGDGMAIAQVLRHIGLTTSTSEALRMIDQGGVRIDGERVSDRNLVLRERQTIVLQVGKRKFGRVSLE